MYHRYLKTPPAAEPITTAEAKDHLRVVTDDEDALVASLVKAARQLVERVTNRALVTQTWVLKADCFPTWFEMPLPPLASVVEITYVDPDGATQTLSSSVYEVDTTSEPGRVRLAYDQDWPSTRAHPQSVSVEFMCGFGDAEGVPETLRQAIRLLVGHFYENREAVGMNAFHELPMAVRTLLAGETITEDV